MFAIALLHLCAMFNTNSSKFSLVGASFNFAIVLLHLCAMFNTNSSNLSKIGAIISRTLLINSLYKSLLVPWCWCLCCPLVHFCKRLLWLRTKYSSYYSFSQPQTTNAAIRGSNWCIMNNDACSISKFQGGYDWHPVLCFACKTSVFSGSCHAPARCVQYTTQEKERERDWQRNDLCIDSIMSFWNFQTTRARVESRRKMILKPTACKRSTLDSCSKQPTWICLCFFCFIREYRCIAIANQYRY